MNHTLRLKSQKSNFFFLRERLKQCETHSKGTIFLKRSYAEFVRIQFGKEVVGCGNMKNPTANNRESTRIAFFQFRPLDLRSRPYAMPYWLRVAGTAKRKMLENPRRGFSVKTLKSM